MEGSTFKDLKLIFEPISNPIVVTSGVVWCSLTWIFHNRVSFRGKEDNKQLFLLDALYSWSILTKDSPIASFPCAYLRQSAWDWAQSNQPFTAPPLNSHGDGGHDRFTYTLCQNQGSQSPANRPGSVKLGPLSALDRTSDSCLIEWNPGPSPQQKVFWLSYKSTPSPWNYGSELFHDKHAELRLLYACQVSLFYTKWIGHLFQGKK